jgi:sugar fermentation stimulation protein A
MRFPVPLVRGRLIQRYKRFLADVELASGEAVTAHCANSGSMLGVSAPGSEVWLSPAAKPGRKLEYQWEMIRVEGGLVGINTMHPNRLVAEAVAAGAIPELAGYASLRREVRYGANSRIDLLLEGGGRPPCYVEIKNVHLRRSGPAEFPDAVTARGAKHLVELANAVAAGARAVMVYLVQRGDCDSFRLAADIDPAYADAFATARGLGVEAVCYACELSPEEIRIARPLPIEV